LSAGFEANTRDPFNTLEQVPHTNKVLALIEYFGSIIGSHAQVIGRADLSREMLAPYGISQTDRYAVLHAGARIKFSRWPYYRELASMILERTELKVLMFADNPQDGRQLVPDAADAARFRLLDRRLPFDEFDALLSFCTVFVGNDSGPKHLAALRGAKVVSIHMARNNWNEWGHENEGYILSRRVPCAGCVIHHFSEECGKDFACITNIRPEEVFAAVKSLL
jgi:ADP-heptose:LPS heptosyltransferase